MMGFARGCSSVGRASACHAEGRGFEPLHPLHKRPRKRGLFVGRPGDEGRLQALLQAAGAELSGAALEAFTMFTRPEGRGLRLSPKHRAEFAPLRPTSLRRFGRALSAASRPAGAAHIRHEGADGPRR